MNNKVTWVVENFAKEKSFTELVKAVEELGYPLIKIDGDYEKKIFNDLNNKPSSHYIGDFTYEQTQNLIKQDRKCVVLNGTIKMCRLIHQDLGNHCSPKTYSNFPKYKCSAYYSHFGPYLFNDKYCLMPLLELERQKFDVWGHYGKDSVIFIRPDSGEKDFQAGLLDIIDLGKFIDNNEDCHHDLMLVSTPKNIKWEGRFICSKHKEIIAYSTYRFQGNVTRIPSVPEKSLKFCQEVLNNVSYVPDSVFCLDLVEDNDGNYWVMELTSFSSAGLYCADMKKIVKRVSEIAWEDFIKC